MITSITSYLVPAITRGLSLFFGFFFHLSKEKVRACFFAAEIGQPTSCYFWHNEVRKKQKAALVHCHIQNWLILSSQDVQTDQTKSRQNKP